MYNRTNTIQEINAMDEKITIHGEVNDANETRISWYQPLAGHVSVRHINRPCNYNLVANDLLLMQCIQIEYITSK